MLSVQASNTRQVPLNPKTMTVKCPLCNRGKLIDATTHITFISIRTYPPPSCQSAQYFLKCPNCKKQIGISIKQ